MLSKYLAIGTVDDCPHRLAAVAAEGTETATCGLLKEVLGAPGAEAGACAVDRSTCEACRRAAPATSQTWNPVVSSLVYARASKLSTELSAAAADEAGEEEAERLGRLVELARARLDVIRLEPLTLPPPTGPTARPLASLVPPPGARAGAPVREWAVGVTTSPRVRPALGRCLDSLVRAGWDRPTLFIDAAVLVPDRHAHLPCTVREERVGAWPNYLLSLTELLLRHPRADAYLLVQDDALFFDGESVRDYLERMLWPGRSPCLVSLYCTATDSAERPGWHASPGIAGSGPVALIFPGELARAFVTDPAVFEHRWNPDEFEATSIGGLIPSWAYQRSIPIWFPTPSLVQHIGDTSTLWPDARALGPERSGRFLGDEI